jgi:hypothetical protein
MDSLVARLHADLPGTPAPLLVGQIHHNGGSTDAIREAQAGSWANADIYPGPVTYDMGPLVDDLHFQTDVEAATLADRWWAAIDEALFDGWAGIPPSVVSAVVRGTAVTLLYDRDLEVAANYGAGVWAFDDDGVILVGTSAVKVGNREVVLTLASAPVTSSMTLVLGLGTSAQGEDVPRGLGGQPALPESVGVTLGESTPWQVLSVRNLQRTVSIS